MYPKNSRQWKTHLVWLIAVSEGVESPGSSRVVLVACNALQPQGHRLSWYFLWMNPSGVVDSRIHAHVVVVSLERLDQLD